jgi:hypothetical protein
VKLFYAGKMNITERQLIDMWLKIEDHNPLYDENIWKSRILVEEEHSNYNTNGGYHPIEQEFFITLQRKCLEAYCIGLN